MTILARAKTATIDWVTGASPKKLTVVPAGSRVCVRSYSVFEYPSNAYPSSLFQTTTVNFRTGSDTGDILLSDRSTLYSWIGGLGTGTPTQMVLIPGDGVLFPDGLFVELALNPGEVARLTGSRTFLNVVYS